MASQQENNKSADASQPKTTKSKPENATSNGQKDGGKTLKVRMPKVKKKPAETVSKCPSEADTGSDMGEDISHRSPLQAVDPMQWNPHAAMYPPIGQMHQMPYYPMFPTPQWPQWDTYDEAEDDVGVDEYDDDNDTEPEIEQDHDEVAEKPQQKTVITSALLASHKTKCMDETGEDANAEVAELANQIWTTKQEKEALKDLFKRNQRPVNVNIRKVDINEEVLTSIPQSAKSRDMRLRSVQGLTAKATVPFVATLMALIDENKPIDRQKLVDSAIDGVTMLAYANQQLNQLRRDLLRPTLQPRFQQLCSKPNDDDTQYLFGTKIVERIKNASQVGKLARRGRGRGNPRFQPYQYSPYPGYSGYASTYQPRGATRGPFFRWV